MSVREFTHRDLETVVSAAQKLVITEAGLVHIPEGIDNHLTKVANETIEIPDTLLAKSAVEIAHPLISSAETAARSYDQQTDTHKTGCKKDISVNVMPCTCQPILLTPDNQPHEP